MKAGILYAIILLTAVCTLTSCNETGTIQDISEEEYIEAMATLSATESETTEPTSEAATEPTTSAADYLCAPDDYEPSGSCRLNVEAVLQNPELPTGCEVTALSAVLNYFGFDIDKVELCDNYLPIEYEAVCTFDEAFIGDPKSGSGFGCNAPVIVKTAESYFEHENAEWSAYNLTGTDFSDLYYQIDQGRPVIIWASMGLSNVTMSLRWTTEDGDEAWFAELEHCMVLTGYDVDAGIVYTADPLKGSMEYSAERFEDVYGQMEKQAVVIYEM